jgi:hypothetical protein
MKPDVTRPIPPTPHNSQFYFQCPVCHKDFGVRKKKQAKEKLETHLNEAHPIRVPYIQQAPRPKPRTKAFTSASDEETPQEVRNRSRRYGHQPVDMLDANRGMGAFARDNGRFGSHALHDRFDDEGKP